MAKKIVIYHLYPDAMNLYGDLGNIIAIQKRCQWRGIETEVVDVKIGDKVDFTKADLLFMGGGQDSGQKIVTSDLVEKGPAIKEQIEEGMPALLICGGFQLFGHYFQTNTGDKIPGIGVFDAVTVAGNKRLIGNVVIDIAHALTDWENQFNIPPTNMGKTTLVGFENHSGKTTLAGDTKPLGYVIRGYGNKGDGGYEGAIHKNAFGSYLHGSLLPKNPWLTDHLIMCALYRRYGNVEALKPLDDAVEIAAHEAAIRRTETAKTVSI
jgi:CobQ-like glutamine amidotransferase family enzyme